MSHKYGTRSKKNNIHNELSDNEDYDSDPDDSMSDDSIDSKGNIRDLIDSDSEPDTESENNLKNLIKQILHNNVDKELDYNSESDSDYDGMDIDDIDQRKELKQIYNMVEYDYYKSLSKDEKHLIYDQESKIKKLGSSEIPIRFKILKLPLSFETKNRILKQLEYYQSLDEDDADFSKMYRWFQEFGNIPFGKYTRLDILNNHVKAHLIDTYKSLDNCIYGHEEAKVQILQYISKSITNPQGQASILALEGPMGNGKTTLIKEGVCNAMNRPFAFIPLGGQSEASYLVGESMSIIGSKQGIITETLCRLGCMNPIIYFDELDKISESEKGKELINVLIHITDKSQNSLFRDRYFSMCEIDLSQVMFIFSFNDINKIDPILRDRLFVIKTTGFKTNDKVSIAKKYLLKNIYNDIGIDDKNIIFNNNIIKYIIEKFTHNEEGVRMLKKCLEDILLKLNLLYLINRKEDIDMDEKNVKFISDIAKNVDIEEICTFFKKHKNISFPYNLEKEFCDQVLSKPGNLNNLMMYT